MTGKPIDPADHELHERLLVVRFATKDELEPAESARARALVKHCPACAALSRDVLSISRATATSLTPMRPRDFRLTPEQAAAAHGSWVRRWLARLSGPGTATLRPLARAAVALGLLLVVFGGGLPGFGGATSTRTGGAAVTDQAASQGPFSAASAAVGAGDVAALPAPVAAAATEGLVASSQAAVPPGRSAAQDTAVPTITTDTAVASGLPAGGPESNPTAHAPEGSIGQVFTARTASPSEPPKVASAGVASAQPSPARFAVPAPAPVDSRQDSESPAAVFGLLIGTLGLVVLALTWVARRITKDSLLR